MLESTALRLTVGPRRAPHHQLLATHHPPPSLPFRPELALPVASSTGPLAWVPVLPHFPFTVSCSVPCKWTFTALIPSPLRTGPPCVSQISDAPHVRSSFHYPTDRIPPFLSPSCFCCLLSSFYVGLVSNWVLTWFSLCSSCPQRPRSILHKTTSWCWKPLYFE